MHPITDLILTVFHLAEIALLIWIVLGLLITFNIVNRWNPVVSGVYNALNRLFEPLLRPIRRVLPDLGGIDLSPMVLILGLYFLGNMIRYYF